MTIKAFTDFQQSKELAKILPLESADAIYYYHPKLECSGGWYEFSYGTNRINLPFDIPCWSLSALFGVLPNYQLQTQDDGIGILCSCNGKFNIVTASNHIDACYEIIIELNKQG